MKKGDAVSRARLSLGSARASRAGFGAPPKRNVCESLSRPLCANEKFAWRGRRQHARHVRSPDPSVDVDTLIYLS